MEVERIATRILIPGEVLADGQAISAIIDSMSNAGPYANRYPRKPTVEEERTRRIGSLRGTIQEAEEEIEIWEARRDAAIVELQVLEGDNTNA